MSGEIPAGGFSKSDIADIGSVFEAVASSFESKGSNLFLDVAVIRDELARSYFNMASEKQNEISKLAEDTKALTLAKNAVTQGVNPGRLSDNKEQDVAQIKSYIQQLTSLKAQVDNSSRTLTSEELNYIKQGQDLSGRGLGKLKDGKQAVENYFKSTIELSADVVKYFNDYGIVSSSQFDTEKTFKVVGPLGGSDGVYKDNEVKFDGARATSTQIENMITALNVRLKFYDSSQGFELAGVEATTYSSSDVDQSKKQRDIVKIDTVLDETQSKIDRELIYVQDYMTKGSTHLEKANDALTKFNESTLKIIKDIGKSAES